MGHDISAYNDKGREIAYLRFSAFNSSSHDFYDLINANECDGGVSGNGSEKLFNEYTMQNALDELMNKRPFEAPYHQEVKKFINACLKEVKKNETVKIGFY